MTNAFTGSEFWNERYENESYMYGVNANDFLQAQAHLINQGGRVLSLAEGEGRNAVYLAQQGYRVRGVDFSSKGREKALNLAQTQKVSIQYDLADLTCYELGVASWDAVVSIFCHLHDTDRLAVYELVKRALKPGGVFILEAYNRKQLQYGTGGPSDASYLASLDQLKAFFEEFGIVLEQDIVREIYEGEHHYGLSAVTQFVARKPIE